MVISKIKSLIFVVFISSISVWSFDFADLPVRHEGRIKPFESFAKAVLLQFSGRESVSLGDSTKKSQSAVEWVGDLLFRADSADRRAVFLINDPQTAVNLGIEPKEIRRYSYRDLAPGIYKIDTLGNEAAGIEARDRTPEQSEMLRLKENIELYRSLKQNFEVFLPSPDFHLSPELSAELQLVPGNQSFYTLMKKIGLLAQRVEALPSKPISEWTKVDTEALNITRHIYEWTQLNHRLGPQVVIAGSDWLSPWQLVANQSLLSKNLRIQLDAWQVIVDQWNQGMKDSVKYSMALNSIAQEQKQKGSAAQLRIEAIQVEQIYNHIHPFRMALALYLIGALLFLVTLRWSNPKLLQTVVVITALGLMIHIFGIAARMYISQRPPVTNLYETFLFVGAVVVLLGQLLVRFGYMNNGAILSSFGGLALTWLSGRFAADGDTLKVLQAVLDSNFWLSTHVVAISLGYSGVVAAGLAGHVFLIQRMFGVKSEVEEATWKSMHALLGFGLLMALVGTVLGGVWADQSWGRFWGWDPKENGALLIVIWCAILYHARLAGWLQRVGMALGCAFGVLVVVLAWFGINLLGVGLHSYGFTQGAEVRFFLYVGIQILLLAILAIGIQIRKSKNSSRKLS